MLLKQSANRNCVIFMTDSADHVAGKTGLTLTITASKDGGAFASITPTVTELANGWYSLALTTTHTNTLGDLALHITSTGADPTDKLYEVLTDLPGAISSSDITAIKAKTDNLPSDPADESLIIAATDAIYNRIGAPAGASMAADIASVSTAVSGVPAGVWAVVMEGAYTAKQFMRLIGSATLGKLSGGSTATNTFRDTGDTKNRITATVDASGNRTAVTLDPS